MTVKTKASFVLGTWFGAGKSPVAPGTFGSLAALPFGWAILHFGGACGLAAAAFAVFFIGVWSADVVMRETNTEDPGMIVIDEVVGQWIALLCVPADWIGYLLAFALFRVFDISKPWPACWAASKLRSATGVMLDDVFAGLYALLCAALSTHYFMPDGGWLNLLVK